MQHKVNCLVCGAQLKYEGNYTKTRCHFCQEEFESNVMCINGHFVCDKCHSSLAGEVISQFCIDSESKDPIELAVSLMKKPEVAMHGPEHHFLVPAVLLASYYNLKNEPDLKERRIKSAQRRASNVLGGFCGFYGDCGAAVGTGIFISLITGANPLSKQEWKLSNLMTAKSLFSLANVGGPRCCKRTSFLSIIEASDFLREHFGVNLPVNKDIKCVFSPLNKECLKDECPFYNGTSQST
ncbi:DUF5714 domain-containing protein [Chloroflexota bacterium]